MKGRQECLLFGKVFGGPLLGREEVEGRAQDLLGGVPDAVDGLELPAGEGAPLELPGPLEGVEAVVVPEVVGPDERVKVLLRLALRFHPAPLAHLPAAADEDELVEEPQDLGVAPGLEEQEPLGDEDRGVRDRAPALADGDGRPQRLGVVPGVVSELVHEPVEGERLGDLPVEVLVAGLHVALHLAHVEVVVELQDLVSVQAQGHAQIP